MWCGCDRRTGVRRGEGEGGGGGEGQGEGEEGDGAQEKLT